MPTPAPLRVVSTLWDRSPRIVKTAAELAARIVTLPRRTDQPVIHAVWLGVVALAGLGLIALGIIMLVLPGPGLLFIIGGLAVWATEFAFAQVWLNAAKRKAAQAKEGALTKLRNRKT